MKKSLRKAIPLMILASLVAMTGFILDGMISLRMMDAIDAVVKLDRDTFKAEILNLFMFALVLVPVSLLQAVCKSAYKKKAIVSAKRHYMKQIFSKEINQFQSENNATYISALTNDVANIESNYIDGIYEMVVSVLNFIVGICIIAYVSPIALAAGMVLAVLGAVISIVMGKPLQKHQEQRSNYYASYTAYIKEFLSAFHIIKSNNLQQKVREDFYKKSEDIQNKGYTIEKIISYISATQTFLMLFIMYGLLSFSVYLTLKGHLTLGGVILIINSMEKVMMPVMQATEWVPKILSTKGIFSKLDQMLENEENHSETMDMDGFNHSIAFENVSFSYGEHEVLSRVNFKMKQGRKYLILGPSGGGKSTVLKLIRKYFNPTDGQITLDEKDIKNITKETYFHHLANIEQHVFIFEDTVKNNLCLYKEYTDEEIRLAIKRAGLNDFIENHPDGLNRMLVDNGKNISGGEKSRIAIARGLLQHAKIIILDEAFASLDAAVAREIEKTLLALQDVTVINVSHVVFDETKKVYDDVFMVKNKSVLPLHQPVMA